MTGKNFVSSLAKRQKDLADIFRIIEKYPQLEATLPQNLRKELNK